MGHTQLVAMTAIPGESLREPHSRSNLTYSKYSRATWDWWCRKNGIGFTVLDRPLEDDACRGLPPSLQRWIAPSILMKEMGTSGQVLMIDADVMIRWDSPSPFDLAGSCFAAVQDSYALWVQPSIKAYQPLFPNVTLNWWEYFNTGLTIVNNSHCDMLRDFVRFAYERWTDWRCIQQSGNFGIDQTLLNFFYDRRMYHCVLFHRRSTCFIASR